MSDEQQGGWAWEAAQAMKLLRHAREVGDDEGEYTGWIRFAEAVKNAAQVGAGAAFLGILDQRENDVLVQIRQLSHQRKNESDEILLMLKGLQGGQTALQAGFQKVAESVDQMQGEIQELSAELGRSRAHRAELQRVQDEIRAQLMPPEERQRLLDEHHRLVGRVAAIERRLGLADEAP